MERSESTDRTTGDYFLFALAFIGFLVAATGVIVESPGGALTGAFLLLLPILGFAVRSPAGD